MGIHKVQDFGNLNFHPWYCVFQSEAKFEEDKEQVQRKLLDDQNDLLNRYKSREVFV